MKTNNDEINKMNFFKTKTTLELEKESIIVEGSSIKDYNTEIEKRKEIKSTVQSFYSILQKHTNHRFHSWEHCFNTFQKSNFNSDESDYLSLHLAFYLASWGMYRASSGLLWSDYKIHIPTIKIIKEFQDLKCTKNNDLNFDIQEQEKIVSLINDLELYYKNQKYYKLNNTSNLSIISEVEKDLSSTSTLISKIILGTLGCLPAYDRLFKIGLSESKFPKIQKTLNHKSIKQLFDWVNFNKPVLIEIQDEINKGGTFYPIMKIVDMYFWELGRKQKPQNIDK